MVFSIITNNEAIWPLITLIYIFPKTISSVNNITYMPYNKLELIMNMIAAIIGAITIILLLVFSSTTLLLDASNFDLKILVTFFSAFFVFMEVYDLIHELTKYVNLHNQIKTCNSQKEK